MPIRARDLCSPDCRWRPRCGETGKANSTKQFPLRSRMTLMTCAFSPLAIRAMANGCWREWHFRNRECGERGAGTQGSEDNSLEVKPVLNIHRKHPVSI